MKKQPLPRLMPEGSDRNKIEWIARNLTPRFKQLYPVSNPNPKSFSLVDTMGATGDHQVKKDNFYSSSEFLGFGDWTAKDVEDYVKSVRPPMGLDGPLMGPLPEYVSTKYRLLMSYDFSFGFSFDKEDKIGEIKKELESLVVILRLKGHDYWSTKVLCVLPCQAFLDDSGNYWDDLILNGAGSALINFDLNDLIQLPKEVPPGQEPETIWKPIEMIIKPLAELSDEQAEKFNKSDLQGGLNIKYKRRHFDVGLSIPEPNLEVPPYVEQH